jgi:exopolysaccharide biosynthesis polyprenyl glycosylphosphotransferase
VIPTNVALDAAGAPSIGAEIGDDDPTTRPLSSPAGWQRAYANRLVVTDLLVLIWVIFGVQIARFGTVSLDAITTDNRRDSTMSYWLVSVALVVGWMLMLKLFETRSYHDLGSGSAEYRLIADGAVRLFGLVAIVAFVFKFDVARSYILVAFPLGLLALLLSRWVARQWLVVERQKGRLSWRVLLVGTAESTLFVATELSRQARSGYAVFGACIPGGSTGNDAGLLPGSRIPVVGDLEQIKEAMTAIQADTVMITSSGELSPSRLRELTWSLEPGRQHLVVAPGLIDIGGPRIRTRPVAGLPLMHIEIPRYEGWARHAKRAFDIVGATVLVIGLSPLLAVIAIIIRVSGPGPVIFRQLRVGMNGEPFQMLKFRSMVPDAEAQLSGLQNVDEPSAVSRTAGNAVLFKMKDDPRITRFGTLLRRFSLDELPQFINVLNGQMSLVGPRPPLRGEVDVYENHVHRRFLVKPGVTGLWQVSGRSNLSWEDSVRLDLYYVENWSMLGDLVILWRTAKAVLARDGAY